MIKFEINPIQPIDAKTLIISYAIPKPNGLTYNESNNKNNNPANNPTAKK